MNVPIWIWILIPLTVMARQGAAYWALLADKKIEHARVDSMRGPLRFNDFGGYFFVTSMIALVIVAPVMFSAVRCG